MEDHHPKTRLLMIAENEPELVVQIEAERRESSKLLLSNLELPFLHPLDLCRFEGNDDIRVFRK